jgi:hypothetical protein
MIRYVSNEPLDAAENVSKSGVTGRLRQSPAWSGIAIGRGIGLQPGNFLERRLEWIGIRKSLDHVIQKVLPGSFELNSFRLSNSEDQLFCSLSGEIYCVSPADLRQRASLTEIDSSEAKMRCD